MNAIGYVRVSTPEQAREGLSLEAQAEKIRLYASLHGLDLIAVLQEPEVKASIPLAKRPQGAILCWALADDKKIQHVIAVRLDRLFRDAADALVLTRQWEQDGITLHLIDVGGQALNTGSAFGRLFLTILAAFAEWERNVIAERTSLVLQHKKGKGEVYGQVPVGLRRQPVSHEPTEDRLVPDTQDQAARERAQAWRSQGWSLRRIGRALTALGLPSKRAGQTITKGPRAGQTYRGIWTPSAVASLVAET